jgi:hypothetical protein
MRSLDRKGIDPLAGHAVISTSGGDLFTVEQMPDDGHSLRQSFRPDISRVEVQTPLFHIRLACARRLSRVRAAF